MILPFGSWSSARTNCVALADTTSRCRSSVVTVVVADCGDSTVVELGSRRAGTCTCWN
jgi:hypothetical protein